MEYHTARLVVTVIFLIFAVYALATRYWFSAFFWGLLAIVVGYPFVRGGKLNLNYDDSSKDVDWAQWAPAPAAAATSVTAPAPAAAATSVTASAAVAAPAPAPVAAPVAAPASAPVAAPAGPPVTAQAY